MNILDYEALVPGDTVVVCVYVHLSIRPWMPGTVATAVKRDTSQGHLWLFNNPADTYSIWLRPDEVCSPHDWVTTSLMS